MDLNNVANARGYGTGKIARDKLADDTACRASLPDPLNLAQVQARSGDGGHLVPICHFGNSGEDGKDWGLYHEGTDDLSGVFGHDAKSDAQAIATIVNAYRLGILKITP